MPGKNFYTTWYNYSDNYKNVSVCKSEICQLKITEPMEVYF